VSFAAGRQRDRVQTVDVGRVGAPESDRRPGLAAGGSPPAGVKAPDASLVSSRSRKPPPRSASAWPCSEVSAPSAKGTPSAW